MTYQPHLVAVYGMLTRDGRNGREVLLMQRGRGVWNAGKWSLVSGHVDIGETPQEALARELLEEIGVRIIGKAEFKLVVHRSPAPIDRQEGMDARTYIDLYFMVELEDTIGTLVNAEGEEKCSALGWYPLIGLPADTLSYVSRAIRMIDAGDVPYEEVSFPQN